MADNKEIRSGLLVGLLLLILLGVFAMSRWSGLQERGPQETQNPPLAGEIEIDPALGVTLAMEIDGNPSDTVVLAHEPEMTVLDLLETAAGKSADWLFRYQGQGDRAFLKELAGKRNEGATGRNWMVEVNGKLAEISIGGYLLEPGDQVLWKFVQYE